MTVDVEALEAAGYRKVYSTEEWEDAQARLSKSGRYGLSDVQVPYMFRRGRIEIAVEQNTQEQNPFGVPTTVHYPEVAVIQDSKTGARVACDASNTDLILQVAEELSRKVLS